MAQVDVLLHTHQRAPACMHACMYTCMYVCMYVCMLYMYVCCKCMYVYGRTDERTDGWSVCLPVIIGGRCRYRCR